MGCRGVPGRPSRRRPRSILQNLLGNVGTLLAFRVGNTDAEVLQKEFGNEFAAQQFFDLERFQVFGQI